MPRLIGLRPTRKENGVDVVMANWRAVFAPPGISEVHKKALIAAVHNAVVSDAWRDIVLKNQWTDLYLSGDEFNRFLISEQSRIEDIMKALGLI